MMTGHVTDLLSAYLDDQTTAGERARIAAHLEACPACRAHLESLRKTVALVHSADPVRAPEGFRAQVRARLAQSVRPQGIRWAWSWRTAVAAATVVLVGLFTVNLLRGQFPAVSSRRGAPNVLVTAPSPYPGKVALPPGPAEERAAPAPDASRPQIGAPSLAARAPSGVPTPILPSTQRVIRTANVSLDVNSVDETASRLTRIAEDAGGFIADSSYVQTGSAPEGMFVLRVPAPRFADVLSQVEDLGHVQQRRISGQDVTEEYIDLQARIRNLQRYELRLLSFVDRAKEVSDLLAVEQELARVRGEIEMLTGRARYLDRQIDLATIQVSAREEAKLSVGFWDFSQTLTRIQTAFLATIHQLLRAAEALVVGLSGLVPVVALAGLAWLAVRRIRLARGV